MKSKLFISVLFLLFIFELSIGGEKVIYFATVVDISGDEDLMYDFHIPARSYVLPGQKRESSIMIPLSKIKVIEFTGQKAQVKREAAPKKAASFLDIKWVKVSGGSFQMGSNDGSSDEKPVHRVYLDTFYISEYEVTFAQYDKFCAATGREKPSDSGWGRGNRPVIHVSWTDAKAFCDWLARKTGQDIHLPTEAQWEYASRGGNRSRGYKYSGSNNIKSVAWYDGNSGKKTHPVGQKQANELGIYDMSGNVYEWCSDWYSKDYYSNSVRNNPSGPSSRAKRVIRGGCWINPARICRSADRHKRRPDLSIHSLYYLGFRLARGQ